MNSMNEQMHTRTHACTQVCTHTHTYSLAHCPEQFLLNLGYPGPPAHQDDALDLILPGQEEGYMPHL